MSISEKVKTKTKLHLLVYNVTKSLYPKTLVMITHTVILIVYTTNGISSNSSNKVGMIELLVIEYYYQNCKICQFLWRKYHMSNH